MAQRPRVRVRRDPRAVVIDVTPRRVPSQALTRPGTMPRPDPALRSEGEEAARRALRRVLRRTGRALRKGVQPAAVTFCQSVLTEFGTLLAEAARARLR